MKGVGENIDYGHRYHMRARHPHRKSASIGFVESRLWEEGNEVFMIDLGDTQVRRKGKRIRRRIMRRKLDQLFLGNV